MLAPLVSAEGYFLPLESPPMTKARERAMLLDACSVFTSVVDNCHSIFLRLDIAAACKKDDAAPSFDWGALQNRSFYNWAHDTSRDYRKSIVIGIYEIFCHFMRQCYALDETVIAICSNLDLSSQAIDKAEWETVLTLRRERDERFVDLVKTKGTAILQNPSFALCAFKEHPLDPIPLSFLYDPRFFIGRNHIRSFKAGDIIPPTILAIRNLAYFAGLTRTFLGEKICCGYEYSSVEEFYTPEIYQLLRSIQGVEKLDEIPSAFKRAYDFDDSCQEEVRDMLKSIQEGQLVFLSLFYEIYDNGHVISLVFHKDKFAFCSRGEKPIGRRAVECFTYDASLLTLEILTSLLRREKRADLRTFGEVYHYLEERFYTYLPTQVKAVPFPVHRFIKFKLQDKAENCGKTSHFTAFKVSIFLKALAEGKSGEEAGIMAKDIGHIVSHYIRVSLENKVKELNAPYRIKELEDVLRESAEKTARKEAKIAQIAARQEMRCVVS